MTPLNKLRIHLHTLDHPKSLDLYIDYYHITEQTSKKDTTLMQPDLHAGGRRDEEAAALMHRRK